MASFLNLADLFERLKLSFPFLSSFQRESFTTTISIEFPDIGERFVNNEELKECFEERGLIKTLDELPRLRCTITDENWKEFRISELIAIMHTQSVISRVHWQTLHNRACEELTRRPERIVTALYIYEKYHRVEGWCGNDCFKKMFQRIIKAERTLEGQMLLWEEVMKQTEEASSIHTTAKYYVERQKLLAA